MKNHGVFFGTDPAEQPAQPALFAVPAPAAPPPVEMTAPEMTPPKKKRVWGRWIVGGVCVVLAGMFVFDKVYNPNGMNPADWKACGDVEALLERVQAGSVTSHAEFADEVAGIRAAQEADKHHLRQVTDALSIVEESLRSEDQMQFGNGAGQLQVLCKVGHPQ